MTPNKLDNIINNLQNIDVGSDKKSETSDNTYRQLAKKYIKELKYSRLPENKKELYANQFIDILLDKTITRINLQIRLDEKYESLKNEINSKTEHAKEHKKGGTKQIVDGIKVFLYTGVGFATWDYPDEDQSKNNYGSNLLKGVIDEILSIPELIAMIIDSDNKMQILEDIGNGLLDWKNLLKTIGESYSDIALSDDPYKKGRSLALIIMTLIPGAQLKTVTNSLKNVVKKSIKTVSEKGITKASALGVVAVAKGGLKGAKGAIEVSKKGAKGAIEVSKKGAKGAIEVGTRGIKEAIEKIGDIGIKRKVKKAIETGKKLEETAQRLKNIGKDGSKAYEKAGNIKKLAEDIEKYGNDITNAKSAIKKFPEADEIIMENLKRYEDLLTKTKSSLKEAQKEADKILKKSKKFNKQSSKLEKSSNKVIEGLNGELSKSLFEKAGEIIGKIPKPKIDSFNKLLENLKINNLKEFVKKIKLGDRTLINMIIKEPQFKIYALFTVATGNNNEKINEEELEEAIKIINNTENRMINSYIFEGLNEEIGNINLSNKEELKKLYNDLYNYKRTNNVKSITDYSIENIKNFQDRFLGFTGNDIDGKIGDKTLYRLKIKIYNINE